MGTDASGVDRRDAVVAGCAGGEAGSIAMTGTLACGVCHEDGPVGAGVVGFLNSVTDDQGVPGVGRSCPVQVDPGLPFSDGCQVAGRTGEPGLRHSGHLRRRTLANCVYRPDLEDVFPAIGQVGNVCTPGPADNRPIAAADPILVVENGSAAIVRRRFPQNLHLVVARHRSQVARRVRHRGNLSVYRVYPGPVPDRSIRE